MPSWLDELLAAQLDARRAKGLLRQRLLVEPVGPAHVRAHGRNLINFASNDYLGLSSHPALVPDGPGRSGAGASPLVTGYTPDHSAAEAAVAAWKGAAACVLLPSGYQAAHAAVQALHASLQGIPIRFLADRLSHASLIDAILATSRPFRTFPHNDLARLGQFLKQARPGERQIVVTESIFSMDGDAGDLKGLAELKRRYAFALLVDDAHASGVYGPQGAGLAAEVGLQGLADVALVTFSKALGLAGAALCSSQAFCEAVVNWGRAYIYSTAIAPGLARAIPAAIQVLRAEPHRQQRVRRLARTFRQSLSAAGIQLPPGDSPIIPVILGSEQDALDEAHRLWERGFLVAGIRPPTVPRGGSRLRITLSCEHSDEDIERLVQELAGMSGGR